MHRKAALVLAIAASFTALPATANEIFAAQPKTVVTALQELGFRAVIGTNDSGRPMIDSSVSGINYTLNFYGCNESNTDCQWIEFLTSFTLQTPVTLEMVNDWNANNLFTASFLGGDGIVYLNYVVTTSGGLTRTNFDDVVTRWEVGTADFMRHINF